MPRQIESLGAALLLVLTSVILYSGAGNHTRLETESELIWENPAVTGENVVRAFQGVWQAGEFRAQVRPVATLFRAAEHTIFDFDRGSYQTVQIVLHGLAASMVLLLLLRWIGGLIPALLGAFLFLVHPGASYSVLYLGGLSEILGTILFFGVLLLVDGGRRGRGMKRSVTIGVVAFLTMLTKEIGFLLPIVVLGYFARPRPERPGWARWYLPVLLAAGIAVLYRVVAVASLPEEVRRIPAIDPTTALPALPLLLQSVAGITVESGLVLLPLRLSHDYSWLLNLRGAALYWRDAGAILLLVGTLWLVFRRGGRSTPALLALLAFVPLLVPALLPGVTGSVASERNLYLALPGWIGLFLLLGRALGDHRPGLRSVLVGLAVGVILLLGWRSLARVKDFHSSDTLLEASNRAYPDNSQVLFELGSQRLHPPDLDSEKAVDLLRKALEIRPDFPMASVNLGAAYISQQEWGLALRVLDPVAQRAKHVRALRMADAKANYHAGLALVRQERNREAAVAFERTLLFYPEHLGARGNLGLIYVQAPDYVDRGIEHLLFAIQRDSNPERRKELQRSLDRARELLEEYIENRGGTPAELEEPGTGAIGEPWREAAEEGM